MVTEVTEAIYDYLKSHVPSLSSVRFMSHIGEVSRLGIISVHHSRESTPEQLVMSYTEIGGIEVIGGFLCIRLYHSSSRAWTKSISDPTMLNAAVDEINRILDHHNPATAQTY